MNCNKDTQIIKDVLKMSSFLVRSLGLLSKGLYIYIYIPGVAAKHSLLNALNYNVLSKLFFK